MGRMSQRRRVTRVRLATSAGERAQRDSRIDALAAEEPMEIRVNHDTIAVTMRTPGDDFDLAAGFLWSESLLRDPEHLHQIRVCNQENATDNIVMVQLTAEAPPVFPSRNVLTTSACGLCGRESIEDVSQHSQFDTAADPLEVSATWLSTLPAQLLEAQRIFARTGGLHAAGLFHPTKGLLLVREDVGRHNAVDKIVGWAIRERLLPLAGTVLLVSGRASFELVQKASLAGIPFLAAVSAPSTLAVELAQERGITLVGFLREHTMNIYSGERRVKDVT